MDYPVYELIINEDLNDDAEVSMVSFVDRPAIQRIFNKFAEDSYNDYPEAAKNNAKRAVEYAEKNGWGSCGEATGKIRANQIANGENITRETIARISGFRRHQQNKDVPYDEGCGGLMWDAWGGDAMINWAEKKLRQIDKQNFVVQNEEKRIISGAIMLADTPIYRNDATNGEYYVVFTKDTIFKIVQKFFKKGFQSNVNLQHNAKDKVSNVTMFESFISDKDRGILPMKGFEDTPDGSWFGSFKVDDDNVWEMVKSGEIKGFSVEGIFEYTRKESKEEKLMSEIYKILSQVNLGGEGSGCSGDNCGRPKGSGESEINYGTDRNKNIDLTIEYGKKNNMSIVKSDIKNKNIIAMGSSSSNSIFINKNSDYWKDPIGNQKKAFESGFKSSPNPLHVINHEMSHLKHKNLSQTWLNKDYQSKIAEKVSKYAKTNPSEFVAETYAGMQHGIKYDDDVMNLYRISRGK